MIRNPLFVSTYVLSIGSSRTWEYFTVFVNETLNRGKVLSEKCLYTKL